jgi:hypothetical protein
VVFAALAIGSLSLQRTYNAVEAFGLQPSRSVASATSYITRDVRRAQSDFVARISVDLTVVVQSYIESSTDCREIFDFEWSD